MLTLAAIIFVSGLGTNIAQAEKTNSTTKRVQIINKYLAGTPMANLGQILDKEGKKYNVSPYFIVAVAAKESSKGFTACSANRKNVWGLGACGRAWNPPYFKTWTQAVNYFVRFIRGKTDKTSGWPNASSPWQFSGYCKGCEYEWAKGVSYHMNMMGGTTNILY